MMDQKRTSALSSLQCFDFVDWMTGSTCLACKKSAVLHHAIYLEQAEKKIKEASC